MQSTLYSILPFLLIAPVVYSTPSEMGSSAERCQRICYPERPDCAPGWYPKQTGVRHTPLHSKVAFVSSFDFVLAEIF
ncbi:hypothetical protein BJX96DRAFT_147601 [Aspergillus floccosus]